MSQIKTAKKETIVRVVDDEESVRNGLAYLLMSVGLTPALYASAEDFLREDAPSVPGCLILDIKMPGMDGIELQNELIVRKYPHPIVFLSGHGDIDIAVGAVKKGAMDFLQKPINPERFVNIVTEAIKQDAVRSGSLFTPAEVRKLWEKLTEREAQIIRLLMEDVANKDISDRLGLSQRTVENHRAAAYRKLEVNSLTGLKEKLGLIREEIR